MDNTDKRSNKIMFKLTPKQEKFCLKFVECSNATEAYKHSYSTKNMKDKTVNNRAYELLQKGEIEGRISELREELKERALLTIDDIIKELSKIALSDKIDSHKMKALELLGKHLGLYETNINLKTNNIPTIEDMYPKVMTPKEKREMFNQRKKELLGE